MATEDTIKELSDEELETAFSSEAYTMYIREIIKYPSLSIEEQKELGRRAKVGDEKARETLINSTLRWVVNVANHYRSRLKHLNILDIIQEGNIGLLKAAANYDPEISAFTTFATYCIKTFITRGWASKEEEIRKPIHLISSEFKYLRLLENYEKNGEKLPSDEEICAILNITRGELENVRTSLGQRLISLNAKSKVDEDTEVLDFIPSPNNDYEEILDKIVDNNLLIFLKEILNPLHYFIIYYRVLNDKAKTLDDIASYFGVSRERIRQIEAKTLRKIKPYFKEENNAMAKTIENIQKREGMYFEKLKTTPQEPYDIIKYLYLQKYLTPQEKEFYQLKFLSKYNYTLDDMATLMGIPVTIASEIARSLQIKMAFYFKDVKKFREYVKEKIKTYTTSIYKIKLDDDTKNIDYKTLEATYGDMQYDEIRTLCQKVNYDLSSHEEELLKSFFGCPVERNLANKRDIEKEINIPRYGFERKSSHVSIKKLKEFYEKTKDEYKREQQLYLECYFFNTRRREEFLQAYPNSSLILNNYYLIAHLERRYFHIYNYFENNLTREDWLLIKEKYRKYFTDFKIEILDLYYGVNGDALTLPEIAERYDMDYIRIHDICRDARNIAINLKAGITRILDLDKDLYIPYILDSHYDFTKETREILRLFMIENKTYEEISKIMNLNKTRISNIITDAIRKIDNYRFGITRILIVSETELEDLFNCFPKSFTESEKEILRLKYLNNISNPNICQKLNIDNDTLKLVIKKFNKLYISYKIKDVSITEEEIKEEVTKHPSECILTDRERKFASLYYGFKNEYNPEGLKYSKDEVKEMLNITDYPYYHLTRNVPTKVKARKLNLLLPSDWCMERAKLATILNDVHLPISEKEKEIISSLFELQGYPYLSLDELAQKFGDTKGSIRRRYQRAMVSIYKYLNKELDGQLNYEEDIVPILKYFSLKDREKIQDLYIQGLTYEEIADKYNLTFERAVTIMNRIKVSIKEILENPDAKKFDFDYYLEAIKDERLPYYGDLKEAVSIFDLALGMKDEERLSIPQIRERLNLEIHTTTINNVINNLMLSVCKLKEGIYREKTYPRERIERYYQEHYSDIPPHIRTDYILYLLRSKKPNKHHRNKNRIPQYILNDIIKEDYPDAFSLDKVTREEVIEILKTDGKNMNKRIRKELMNRFSIPERMFMNGRDLNHVYRMLLYVDTKLKELESNKLVLSKNDGY